MIQLFDYANFTTSLQHYINVTCSTSPCQIPINVSVDLEGVVRLEEINITTHPSRLHNESYPGDTEETTTEIFNVTILFETGENLVVNLWYNGTNYLTTEIETNTNNATYEYELEIPLVASGVTSETRTFYWNVTDSETTWESEEHSHTVNAISLVNCTGAEMVTLNFSLYNETIPRNSITGDMDAAFDIWIGDGSVLKEFNFSWTSEPYFEVCITPNSTSFQASSFQEYTATGYSTRNYYLYNATLTNATTNISLYLLTSGNSTDITVQVTDETNTGLENVIGRVQRYFIGQDAYLTIAMLRTDSDGYDIVPLDYETGWYRWIFERNGEVELITDPAKLKTTTPIFRITEAVSYYMRRYRTMLGLNFLLNFNNETNVTTFFYNDASSVPRTGCLRVIRETAIGRTQMYSNCQHLSSATITYDLTGQESARYFAVASVVDDQGNTFILDELEIPFLFGEPVFGSEGVFLTSLVVGTVFLAGVFNPIAAIILSIIALSIMVIAGFTVIRIGVLVGLAILGGIIVYFAMRR